LVYCVVKKGCPHNGDSLFLLLCHIKTSLTLSKKSDKRKHH
jgi:hypothetical protein